MFMEDKTDITDFSTRKNKIEQWAQGIFGKIVDLSKKEHEKI